MLRHVLFLLFLYGVKHCSGDTGGEAQQQTLDSKDVPQNGIKKNEVGANGFGANSEKVIENFRNPVLEYLLHTSPHRASAPPARGVVREIRHSQTLLIPNPLSGPSLLSLMNQLPQFQSLKKPGAGAAREPERSPAGSFWSFLRNRTESGGNRTLEGVVSSPVLQLSREREGPREETRIQTYPAVAVVVNTFNGDGSLKKSVTHFQPDVGSLVAGSGAEDGGQGSEAVRAKEGQEAVAGGRQGLTWPLANYFPVVINDPFLSVYNAFATSMYNAVSSMVEYGPEADVCGKGREGPRAAGGEAEVFGEATTRSESLKRIGGRGFGRRRRDATSILVKSREGDSVGVTLEEPANVNTRKVSEGSDLVLRKGGIAIAGPGGAATAYTGGTAIVGPYGTVYKSPEGTAILGPFSKVVNITDDTTFEQILRMHNQMQKPAQQRPDRNFKNYRNFFSYFTDLPVKFEVKPRGRTFARPKILRLREDAILKAIQDARDTEFSRVAQDTPYEQKEAAANETTLVFRPRSKAEAGRNGIALSAPTSHAILYPGQRAHIHFEPESVASAGPSGFAHAHSDLFVSFVRNDTALLPTERRERIR